MKTCIPTVVLLIGAASVTLPVAGQLPTRYQTLEVDRFVPDSGVTFPIDYQISLVEDLIRHASRTFKHAEIVREGESVTSGKPVLRITGTVTKFKLGNRAKRYFVGLGAGATDVKTKTKFIDVGTGKVLFEGEIEGRTISGIAGGSSHAAGEQLAKKIVDVARSHHLIAEK